jgi:hypothetical protein
MKFADLGVAGGEELAGSECKRILWPRTWTSSSAGSSFSSFSTWIPSI